MTFHSLAISTLITCWPALWTAVNAVAEEKILFDFAEQSNVNDWGPQAAGTQKGSTDAKIEIVPAGDAPASVASAQRGSASRSPSTEATGLQLAPEDSLWQETGSRIKPSRLT